VARACGNLQILLLPPFVHHSTPRNRERLMRPSAHCSIGSSNGRTEVVWRAATWWCRKKRSDDPRPQKVNYITSADDFKLAASKTWYAPAISCRRNGHATKLTARRAKNRKETAKQKFLSGSAKLWNMEWKGHPGERADGSQSGYGSGPACIAALVTFGGNSPSEDEIRR